MPNEIDLSLRRNAFRRLWDFAAGAVTATLITCVLALSWLVIETPARAAGFLSVIAIVTILALRFEFGHSWNLYAGGGQVVKAGEDYPLLLQAVGSAYQETGGEFVIFVGGSTVRKLTADDWLLSKELTSRCGRDIQFVNLGSSSQTFSESWDIAALAPANRKRLLLVGINPYRLSFDDGDVISEQSHNPTGIPASFSRKIRLGAKWSPLDLLVLHPAVARQPAEDPFQPDRSSYPGPAWTRPEKLKQANEYIATRALDFHDKFRAGVKWFNRLSDHFEESGGDVRFVITPTDETFQTADRLISNDMRDAVNLLQAKNGILDLHNQGVDLEADDFHDVQHLTAQGRAKLQPVFVTEVSHALGCMRDVS